MTVYQKMMAIYVLRQFDRYILVQQTLILRIQKGISGENDSGQKINCTTDV
jgi:hypothetical protein